MRDCDCSTMARWLQRLLWSLLIGAWLIAGEARAQAPAQPTPDQVKSLLQLLSDPVVKSWIERESKGEATAPTGAGSEFAADEASVSGFFERRLVAAHDHLAQVIAAAPRVPGEWAAAVARLHQEVVGWFPGEMALLLVVFGGLGIALEWLFARATAAARARYTQVVGTDRGVASQGRGPPSAHRDRRHPVLRGRQCRHVHAVRLAAAVPPAVCELSRGRGGRPTVPVPVPLPVLAWSPRAARDPDAPTSRHGS